MWVGCQWTQYSAVLWKYGGITASARIHSLAKGWKWEALMGRFMEHTWLYDLPTNHHNSQSTKGTANICVFKSYSKRVKNVFNTSKSRATFQASWFWLQCLCACDEMEASEIFFFVVVVDCCWLTSPTLKKKHTRKGNRFRNSTLSPPSSMSYYLYTLLCLYVMESAVRAHSELSFL